MTDSMAGPILVNSRAQIEHGVRSFAEAWRTHRSIMVELNLLRSGRLFVFDPETGEFGNVKYVGYANASAPLYRRWRDEYATGINWYAFHGRHCRNAVESALQRPFAHNKVLGDALCEWTEALVGTGAMRGLAEGKWEFISL